jgi:hypothetical protein
MNESPAATGKQNRDEYRNRARSCQMTIVFSQHAFTWNQQVFILGGESLLSRVAGAVPEFDVTGTGMAAS